MELLSFTRIFTNNDGYKECESYPYMDSLAYTVQEFLYTPKVKYEGNDFRMNDHIKLYDFITLAVYFIDNSDSDFGRINIKELINAIRQSDESSQDIEKIEYTDDGIIITNASYELIMALLWTTFVYACVINHLYSEKRWKKISLMLFEEMQENNHYLKNNSNLQLLILQADKAVQVMSCHIVNNYGTEFTPQQEELEQDNPEQKEIEDCKIDDDSAKDISLHDKVRLDLLLRLLLNDGANIDKHGNKKKAAQIMQSITGLPLQTCKNYCSNRDLNVKTHGEEVLMMNILLQALGMKIRL